MLSAKVKKGLTDILVIMVGGILSVLWYSLDIDYEVHEVHEIPVTVSGIKQ